MKTTYTFKPPKALNINGGGILRKLFTALLFVVGFNLLTAQTLIEGQLMFLTLSDEARPGDGRMVQNLELYDVFQEFGVSKYVQAMPFAKTPLLRNVYLIEFTGTHSEFKSTLENDFSSMISDITEDYETQYTYEPFDYFWNINWLWHLNKIQADSAWEITKGDSSILIANWDMKPDGYHPDLETEYAVNYHPITGTPLTRVKQGRQSHGTTTASFATGQTSESSTEASGRPLAAIGFNTKLLPYFSDDSAGFSYIQAVHASTVMDAKVFTVQGDGYQYSDPDYDTPSTNQIFISSVNEILSNGTVIIASGGNFPNMGPLNTWNALTFEEIIIVSGTDSTDHFSVIDGNGNPTNFSNYRSIDLCAPGYNMMGATGTLIVDTTSGDTTISNWPYFGFYSGTSFAAPIVAGTAALIKSINPCLTPATVQHILKTTTDPIADANLFPYRIGTGRLNAYKAVKLAHESYSSKNYTINTGQSITWNDVKFIDTLWIKPGATLTINKDCFFNENGVIIVDTSAKLVVNDATLTTSCRNMWYGIQVWGNKNRSQLPYGNQYAQGRVYLENATIENAKEAVRLWKPFDYNSTGGIVMARNTTFRNNRRAVEFISYQNFHPYSLDPEPNFSRFFNCTFDVNDDYIGMGENYIPFHGFVSMWEVDGVRFEGCDFSNNKTTLYTEGGELIDSELTGFGILTIDAGFSVRPYTASVVTDSCHFARLKYGIKTSSAVLKNTFDVWQTSFRDNITGIYASNVSMPAIVKNSFLINAGQMNTNTDTVLFAGVYLDNMTTAYIVEENNFSSTTGIATIMYDKSIGICINNSGQDDNYLYNNQFEDLFIGVLAQNQNRDRLGEFGLEIKCNRFYNIQYDIAVTAAEYSSIAGIKHNQGSGANDVTAPAGNQFSLGIGTAIDAWDIYCNNQVNQIYYWYHANQGNYHLKPDSISQFFVYTFESQYDDVFSVDNACPSSFSSGGGIELRGMYVSALDGLNESIESTTSLLDMLVDGGDTEGTKETVENAWPSQTMEVRDDLLTKSPYLSDEVLLSAVKQEEALPAVIVTEVLVANPQSARSDTLLDELHAREDVTNSQLDEVEANRLVTGAKESLESKLTGYRGLRDYTLSQLMHSYYSDTLVKNPTDSIIALLQPLEYPSARYQLAEALFHKKDFQQAIDVLDDIAEEQIIFGNELEQHNQFRSMYAWWQTMHNSGKNLFSLTESDLTTLQGIYTQSAGKTRAISHNMLTALGLIDYQESYILPEPGLRNKKVRPRKVESNVGLSGLKVFPNPTKEYMIIECITEQAPNTKLLQLVNSSGHLVLEQELDRLGNYSVVDLRYLPTGTYTGSVLVDGKVHGTVKVVLNK
ncbi:MAG: S8 family serine peptidase [Bacteroidales bacterium]|nr:S8 family serine peptidase [Bacteroidales bacterium]